MATVSFNRNKPQASPATAPAAPAENLPAVVEPMPVGAPAMASSQLEGEFTARDMAVPRLNIGQKSGTMCDDHPEWIGKLVYDKGVLLGDKATLIFTKLRKFYCEDLPYDSPVKPRTFRTYAEAMQAGVQVKDVAELDALIECDEDTDQFAIVDGGGKSYAPARWTVQSSAYGRTVGILLKDLAGWLKNDLASGCYTLTTEKRSNDKNTWFVPSLKTAGAVAPELRDAIREKFGV